MNSFVIEGDFLVIEIIGWWRKILSLKSTFKIPLSHIKNIVIGPEECDKLWHGFRIGAHLPGYYVGGTFIKKSGKSFHHYLCSGETIQIELENEWYSNLYLEVSGEKPEQLKERINTAIERSATPK